MLSPQTIARSHIVDSSQKLEFFQGHLLGWDSQFLVQLTDSSSANAHSGCFKGSTSFAGNTKGMRAAGVGPHVYDRKKGD